MPATLPTPPTPSRSTASTSISGSTQASSPSAASSPFACSHRHPSPAPGARVPFYLMPALGGHDSLRGFRDYRFRGPHAILTQTEYRFEIWSAFDTALFYDAGKVALRREDLNFKNLEDALWLRLPIQHRQRHGSADRRGIRQQRRQASLYCVRRCLLNGCRRCRLPLRAARAAGWRSTRCRRSRPRSIPTIRSPSTTTCRSTRRRWRAIEDSNVYDFVANTFGDLGIRHDVRAQNVNTIDEVPDSSWFVNRIGRARALDRRARSRARSIRVRLARRLEGQRRQSPAGCSRASA